MTTISLMQSNIKKTKNYCIYDADLYNINNDKYKDIVNMVNDKKIDVLCSFDNHLNIMKIADYKIMILIKKRNIYQLNQIILNCLILECLPVLITDNDIINICRPIYSNIIGIENKFTSDLINKFKQNNDKIINFKHEFLKSYIVNKTNVTKKDYPIVIIKTLSDKTFTLFINDFIKNHNIKTKIFCFNTLNDDYKNDNLILLNAYKSSYTWIINTIFNFINDPYIYFIRDDEKINTFDLNKIKTSIIHFNMIQIQFSNSDFDKYPIIHVDENICLRQICHNPTHSDKPPNLVSYDNINDIKYIFKGDNKIYNWWPGWKITSGLWNISEMKKNIGYMNDLINDEISIYDYSLRCYNLGYKCLIIQSK